MKKLLLAALLVFPFAAFAGQTTLAWDYPTDANHTGFRVFCGRTAATISATPVADVGATLRTASVSLPNGRNYCVARAYDAVGESANSNAVTFIDRPTNMREQ